MKADDPMAEEILRRTLQVARSVRTRRRDLKGLLGVVVVLGAAVFPWLRPQSAGEPLSVAIKQEESPGPLLAAPEERIAVMVWRGATPRLEWVALHDLGTVELEFSLDPVFAFADDGM